MAYFPKQVTMASATGSFTVDMGMAFSKVYIVLPTMASSTAIDLLASTDGTSYYQVRKEAGNTTTVQAWTFIVAATGAANGGIVPLAAGFRFYKFICTDSAPTAATVFNIIGGN